MYAIYQAGYSIYGVGDTFEEAIADARPWMDPDGDGPELEQRLCVVGVLAFRGETYGELYARPCTARLVAEVQEYGGDCRYTINEDGYLDLEDIDVA